MTAAWFNGNALAFDTETTGVNPDEARLVTATAVEVGPNGSDKKGEWLCNPGMPIPPEASAIHGITDDVAAVGWKLEEVVPAISEVLLDGWRRGLPLIAMNAYYDLTVLQRARERLELAPLVIGPVLDPLVIDRGMVKFRAGKKARILTALCAAYGVKIEGAHSSSGDALAAARVVWKQARVHTELARFTLAEMVDWQRSAHAKWATEFEQYLRSQGKPDVISPEWPVARQSKRNTPLLDEPPNPSTRSTPEAA